MAGLHLALVERVLDEASHGTSITEEASAKRLCNMGGTGEHFGPVLGSGREELYSAFVALSDHTGLLKDGVLALVRGELLTS